MINIYCTYDMKLKQNQNLQNVMPVGVCARMCECLRQYNGFDDFVHKYKFVLRKKI